MEYYDASLVTKLIFRLCIVNYERGNIRLENRNPEKKNSMMKSFYEHLDLKTATNVTQIKNTILISF